MQTNQALFLQLQTFAVVTLELTVAEIEKYSIIIGLQRYSKEANKNVAKGYGLMLSKRLQDDVSYIYCNFAPRRCNHWL